MKNIAATCIAVLMLAALPCSAGTITVDDDNPADFNNIQAAIDAANDGDTIEIQPGTYTGQGNRDINFLGKVITVRSTNPNDPNIVAATVIDCEGTSDQSHRGFSFSSHEESTSVLQGLTITNGYAVEYVGGAILCEESSPTIANCHIVHNVAQNNGGGIVCYLRSNPLIANCLIMYNTADSGSGGAIMCMESSDATIVNCLIARNVAGQACGGIHCRDSSPHILNCTVTANTAPLYGAGIDCLGGNPRVTNCVVWGNADQTFRAWDATLEISHSIIEGGQEAVSVDGRTVLLWEKVINTDPEFVDPDKDDFRLQTGSYCTDSGTNVSFPAFESNDLDGHPRLIDGDNDTHATVDMGAYESFPADKPHIRLSAWELEFFTEADGPNPPSQLLEIHNGYGDAKNWVITHDCNWLDTSPDAGLTTGMDQVAVSVNSSDLSPGVHTCDLRVLSPDAINSPRTLSVIVHVSAKQLRVPQHTSSIQQAIDHTLEKGSVIIESGTYTGPGNSNINFRGKAITVRSTDPNDPNVVANTIIDCNASSWYPRRGFRFVTNEGPKSILAGLTIINGLAIREKDNRVNGGGIYGYESNPTITNCIIANNSTGGRSKGGGIYFANASPRIHYCLIRANTAGNYGGGLGFDNAAPTIINCIITANTADYGAGIGTHDGHPTITNCTIVANISDGIYCADANIANCIVWDNNYPPSSPRSGRGTPSYQIRLADSQTVSYCDVQDGFVGTGNIDVDPCFVDADAGDYHILGHSLCVNSGDPCATVSIGEMDIDGQPRVLNGWIDIGADEAPATLPILYVSPLEFEVYAEFDGPNPDARSMKIHNTGIDALNWSVHEECPWISIDPTNGQSTDELDEVHLNIDSTGLTPGAYMCSLVVSAPSAIKTPQNVTVTLHVMTQTIYVPDMLPTIQDAINHLLDGGTVVVADGTYSGPGNHDIDLRGKAITVRSENGPETCIIDCNGTVEEPHRGFYFHSNEDADAVVCGFTITGGYAHYDDGAGIYCLSGSPTIANCIIRENRASIAPMPHVIPPDWYPGGYGGGIYCGPDTTPTIRNCSITGNVGGGGGIHCATGSSPHIVGCHIQSNESAGIDSHEALNLMVEDCVIQGNVGSGAGGVYCYGGQALIRNSLISRNLNCGDGGGGIKCGPYSTVVMDNCTIYGNRCDGVGAALFAWGNANPILNNCIIWANRSAEYDGQLEQITLKPLIINYCCLENWTDEAAGLGIISSDPLLTADLHIQAGSPCIDAGDPNLDLQARDKDIDGEAGIHGGRIDIGADEFIDTDADALPDWWESRYFPDATAAEPGVDSDGDLRTNVQEYLRNSNPVHSPTSYFVHPIDGNDNWDGLASSRDGEHGPLATIQSAIQKAVDGRDDEIILAPATYRGHGNRDIELLGKRLTLRSTDPNDPNVIAQTLIDCQGTLEENHRGFDFHGSEQQDTVIDGLTIAGGHQVRGGAVYCDKSSPTLRNCTIRDNVAESYGAGIACRYGGPVFFNCTVRDNVAEGYGEGGGIHAYCSGPTVSHCTIERNIAEGFDGGGVYYSFGAPTIEACSINGNSAHYAGGGIYNDEGEGTISDCIFVENSAMWGGAICNDDYRDTSTVTDCAFIRNSAEFAGAIYNAGDVADSIFLHNHALTWGGAVHSSGTITNCTFAGNTAGTIAGAIYCYDGTVSNSLISGNYAGEEGGGVYLAWRSDDIINCTITDNKARDNGGGICARVGFVVTLRNSIVWGNTATQGSQLYTDYYQSYLDITVANTDIEGGFTDVHVEPGVTIHWSPTNIATYPCFVSPGYWDPNGTHADANDDFWVNGDYHVKWNSPCIDAGEPGFHEDPNECDIDGEPRVMAGRVDIGADEVGPKQADLSRDGLINFKDYSILIQSFGSAPADPNWYVLSDLYDDNHIDYNDLALLIDDWLWKAQWHTEPQ